MELSEAFIANFARFPIPTILGPDEIQIDTSLTHNIHTRRVYWTYIIIVSSVSPMCILFSVTTKILWIFFLYRVYY